MDESSVAWEHLCFGFKLGRGCISAEFLLNFAFIPSFLLTPADLLHALLAHENPCLLSSELLAGTQFPGTEAGGNLKKPRLELFF